MENINQSSTIQQAFSGYLKNPDGIDISDEKTLESLIEKFPYSQMLHAFDAKCHSEETDFDTYLEKAALYIPERDILYNIIHKPESFQSAFSSSDELSTEAEIAQDNKKETNTPDTNNEHPDKVQDEHLTVSQPTESAIEEYDLEVQEISDISNPEGYSVPVWDEDQQAPATETANNENSIISDAIEVETNNEINKDSQPVISSSEADESVPSTAIEEGKVNIPDQPGKESLPEKPADETEKLIISNIASSDFFRFEEKLDDQLISQGDAEHAAEKVSEKKESEPSGLNSSQGVSKYDDDKMPYTFLWWLNKTRKEHSDTYQPYVSFKLDTTEDIKKEPAADLNHQIIENIFHLQSPLENIEEEKPKTVEFTIKRKDDQIIERFIREEPQIRPPTPEKLDNENKARKSSEDSYDMVSETLANVYIEQMLFHKAIDTYKKLSLKFPEKSAYFADQIRKLETTN